MTWLEQRCDEVNDDASSRCARSCCPAARPLLPSCTSRAPSPARRARHGAARGVGEPINPQVLAYINRLSDLLFILARAANPPHGEVLWVPGGEPQIQAG